MKVSKRDALSALVLLVPVVTIVATLHASQTTARTPAAPLTQPSTMSAGFANLPLSFEPNEGQAAAGTKFTSRGRGYAVTLNEHEAVLSLQQPTATVRDAKADYRSRLRQRARAQIAGPGSSESVHMTLVGARRDSQARELDELPGRSHYVVGSDPSKWHTDIPTYARVKFVGVYPGIDLVYYGNQQHLEYDFVLAPGADPAAIRLSLETERSTNGVVASNRDDVRVDGRGDLVIHTASGDVRFLKPVVYQMTPAGDREFVHGRYVLLANHRVGFDVGAYDKARTLTIDPVLSYSTFLGGGDLDSGTGIAVDSSGNAYLSGSSCTVTPDRLFCDATVTKVNSTGTAVLYSTVLAGSKRAEFGRGIAIDADRNVYATGSTCSSDFPVTTGALQTTLAGVCDAFVAKLDAGGKPLYSTYLGGSLSPGSTSSDQGIDTTIGIAVDGSRNVYVVGETCSSNFPVKNAFENAFRGHNCDGFASKLNPGGNGAADLLYSTYLSASTEFGEATGIAVDSSGLAYIVGDTESADFPTTAGAFQPTIAGDVDLVVLKVDMTKAGRDSLLYSTFLGGSRLDGFVRGRIAVDALGIVYVTGATQSADFPTTPGAFQTTFVPLASDPGNSVNGFVTKLNPAGTGASDLLYSTFFGVAGRESVDAQALTPSGDLVIGGTTDTNSFPVTADAFQSSLRGLSDAFVSRLHLAGQGESDLVYSTFLGGDGLESALGLAVDADGNTYVAGATGSADFPHSADAAQTTFGGGLDDAFVARLPVGNFSLSPVGAITGDIGGSATSSVTVTSIGEFDAAVSLGISGQPAGVTATFDPAPVSPSAGGSVASALRLTLPFFASAGTFDLSVTGTSGMLAHAVPTRLTVQATTAGTGTTIGGITAAGCIDNSGISGALLSKLTQAQAFIDAGQIQSAVNTLSALLNELRAQSGKHISTTCTVDGQTFNPVDVLIADVSALLANLKVGSTPNPVMGYVVNASGAGIGGATVSILNTANTATSDSTGFYFFANTGSLTTGTSVTATVTSFPAGYRSATPASRTFTWQGSTLTLANFVLNKK